MKKKCLIPLFLITTLSVLGQTKMRPIEELINYDEPAWDIVKQWIDTAKNKIEILQCDSIKAKDVLFKTQVTTRSPMGAVIYMTGGILIDNGWIRILGSGNPRLTRTIPGWNKGKTFKKYGDAPLFLLIADDAIGGFFAINGGSLGIDTGKVYYLSPDALKWESLEITYTEFLFFCFNNNLNNFYSTLRWTNWKEEVLKLEGDKVFNFTPPLWSKEGKDINNNSKKIVPIEEQYKFNIQARKELHLE